MSLLSVLFWSLVIPYILTIRLSKLAWCMLLPVVVLAIVAPILNKLAADPHYSYIWKCVMLWPDWDGLRYYLNTPREYGAVKNDASIVDKDGTTLLLMACRFPNAPLDVIEKLIEANPRALSTKGGLFQQFPLHLASERGASVEVIRALYEEYPEAASIQDRTGKTPLDWAKFNQHEHIVKFLEENINVD